jgi:hypothetical protein
MRGTETDTSRTGILDGILSRRTALWFFALFPFVVLISFLLYRLDFKFIMAGGEKRDALFGIFQALVAFVLAVLGVVALRKKVPGAATGWLPAALCLAFSFHALTLLSEMPAKSGDYLCFERGAMAAVEHRTLYSGTRYEYPPLMAQVMGFCYKGLVKTSPCFMKPGLNPEQGWFALFFIYQALQFLWIVLLFFLLRGLGLRLGFRDPWLTLLVTALLIFNTPLVRAVRYNQTNIFVLDLILLAFVAKRRGEIAGGFAAAFGALFKFYPVMLAVPWLVLRRIRSLAAFCIGGAVLIGLQTKGFRDFTSYLQAFDFFMNHYPRYSWLHNSCFISVFDNTLNLVRHHLYYVEQETMRAVASVLARLAVAAVVFWFGWRLFQRERGYRSAIAVASSGEAQNLAFLRGTGHLMDMLPLMLLVSPSIWEHHFLLMLPFALWAVAVRGKRVPVLLAIALFLIFVPPVITVYPFSYHRLLGLLMLVILVPPLPSKDDALSGPFREAPAAS